MGNKVYLVDGSGYIFRAFYGVQTLTTKDGFPTNALYGFTRMLSRLLHASDSNHAIVVFDAGRKTFRNDLYPEYKANRSECPEDLAKQMPYFQSICEALGLQIIVSPGFEADDVIATLAKRFSDSGVETVVVSGDKDLMQLVGDHTTMWDTMKDKRYDREGVIEKFGVPPEQVAEVLAVTGDTSDNIPGLRGAGPKTAEQLIKAYGTVENIIKSTDKIKEDATLRNRKKIAETIEANPEILRISRELVEVRRDAPALVTVGTEKVGIETLSDEDLLSASERQAARHPELEELFTRFEFTSLLKELNLGPPRPKATDASEFSYRTIFSDDFPSWLEEIKKRKEFAFDVETTSLDTLDAKLVGAAFSWSNTEAFYIPIAHIETPEGQKQISLEKFLSGIKPLFEDTAVTKVGQNLKYDIGVMVQHGVTVGGPLFDTMIAAYLLNPDKGGYGLTRLAHDYLGRMVVEYEDLEGVKENFSHVPINQATRYSAEDAHFAWLLKEHFQPLLETRDLIRVFHDIEMPLVPILSEMERTGVKIDIELLQKLSEEFGSELETIRAELYRMAGTEFNINSPKQLADIMFNNLGISTKGVKKTKTGLSTDSNVLEMLSAEHEFPALILKYRTIFKLKSTYSDALPTQVSPIDGRLHSRFNQAVTGTGRLSSTDPNLQNIPIQTAQGRRIRNAFVAEKGRVLLSADYSQIELRILAHMSDDKNLIQAFADKIDIHAKTAREILGLPIDAEITADQRRLGKTINFGIIYGMSGFRLGRELGIPFGVASKYIEQYFERYPGVRILFDRLEKDAREKGEVSTLFGRKRILTELDTEGRDKGFVQRVAVNAPLQGTAADLVKIAMIRVNKRIKEDKLPFALILQIHDELVFECDEQFARKASEMIQSEMQGVADLRVPLVVEVGIGPNWEAAHS